MAMNALSAWRNKAKNNRRKRMPDEEYFRNQKPEDNGQSEEFAKSLNSFTCPVHKIVISKGDECPKCQADRERATARK
jgi:hypothetical protein